MQKIHQNIVVNYNCQQIQNMQKHRSSNRQRDEGKGRTVNKNKENPLGDTVFLIQNENQVLRMKNTQLNTKIKQLKIQLQTYTDSIALKQSQIDNMKSNIQASAYNEDIEIQNEKKLLMEKLSLLKSNEQIVLRKIKEARQATIFEEEKVAGVQNDRKGIQMEILSMKAQNEGTKIILRNIEDQNQKLRLQNETLISKRRVHEPKEKQIAIQIEERIRFIKNQQQNLKSLRKYETSKLLNSILTILYNKKLRDHFSNIDRTSLIKKIAKKKLIQMGLIKRKYLIFIKSSILQKLRSNFRPLVEQETARRIIWQTHKRRVKAFIWRKWRTATKNAQFTTMRRFQFQNLLQKLSQSFGKTNLFASFNMIKYYKNDPIKEGAIIKIEYSFSKFMSRSKMSFFSNLRAAQKTLQIGEQIEASSKQQSQMLVMSLYFSAWCKLAKSRGIQNLNLKRRYFKELKKLIMIKNRRILGEMLTKTNEKLTHIDIQSKIFTGLKKQMVIGKLVSLTKEGQSLNQRTSTLDQNLLSMRNEKKQLYQQLALIKVSKYLKTKMQKAFDIWRLRKQQSKILLSIINMVESKKSFDKNFAFAKILKKRFAMLKKSIRDKIAGCQFSYNYLLDENKHIKQVLDTKQHELEKSKFMNLMQKIMRNQKLIKLNYFYKFMKRGFKFWKFRKTSLMIDQLIVKKVKIVFMWLLRQDQRQIKEEHRIQSFVQGKQKKINNNYYRLAMGGFKSNRDRNRRFRRVIGGIFDRNFELDFYAAFGKIRNEEHLYNRSIIQADIDQVQGQIDQKDAISAEQEQKITILKNRLQQKEDILQERKILGLYLFFVKNVKIKLGSYIKKWNQRVKRQNRVLQFAEILERKTRIMLKNKFMLSINKKNQDYTLTQLQDKLKKFQTQYQGMAQSQQKYLQQNEKASKRMKTQNEFFKNEGQSYEKKTDFMTSIKLKGFAREWGKKMLKFSFRQWRNQTDLFIQTWSNIEKRLGRRVLQQNFNDFKKVMKDQLRRIRVRTFLSKIYHQTFRNNARMAFRTWRFVQLKKGIQLWLAEQQLQMRRFGGLQKTYKYAIKIHNGYVDYRQFDPLLRSICNAWRQYTQKKIFNNMKKDKLDVWLYRGYSSDFIRLLKNKVTKRIEFKQRYGAHMKKWQILKMKSFFEYVCKNKVRRKSVNRLFINKFCPFIIHKTQEEFLTRVKNYINNKAVNIKTDKTQRIQTVIATFEKKRKSILNFYLRKWRRNQYEIRIAKNLLRRITKNAINWKVKDLFYTWKLQTEAKKVKQMHQQQGQVKKRKIQIGRLRIFLEDFKKQKGLLLQDDGGKFVLSPRFQQKKDQQVKRDNNLRYKFISRLILSMNGYAGPVKAWNNIKMYKMIRQKFRKYSKFTINQLRRPDLYYAFRTWNKATTDFNKMFDVMERKALIKILNRQKDKMQMQYSKKLSLQQKIQDQMKVHKVLAYQQDKKQKLCVHVFLKNLRKIKHYTLMAWKNRVSEMKEAELWQLQDQGNTKINNLEEEVNDLEAAERQLKETNEKLEYAVRQALQIAEMVKRITEERDILSNLITEKLMTCESLQEQNEQLNAKLYQAQKQAMNLLILSGNRL